MGEKEYTPADFPPGTVVRHILNRSLRGVVVRRVRNDHHGWTLYVRIHTKRYPTWYLISLWEPVPHGDLDADEAAVALANAVLTGDRTAALALADRVAELARTPGV